VQSVSAVCAPTRQAWVDVMVFAYDTYTVFATLPPILWSGTDSIIFSLTQNNSEGNAYKKQLCPAMASLPGWCVSVHVLWGWQHFRMRNPSNNDS
jgi:hypothetical protein